MSREAALQAANRVREKMGFPPVDHLYRGEPNDPWTCAITNTIYDDDVPRDKFTVATAFHSSHSQKAFGSDDLTVEVWDQVVGRMDRSTIPKPIIIDRLVDDERSFIADFDNENYSDLIREGYYDE